MGIDLSNIQLPPEDANKPAEIDATNPAGDEGATNESNVETTPADNTPVDKTVIGKDEDADREPIVTPPDKKEDDKPDDVKPPEEKPADADKKEEEKPPADAAAAGEKDKKPDEKPVDFHEHPDWKKREEKLHTLEIENATLKGKQEVLESRAAETIPKKEEVKSASQIAEERVRKMVDDGLVNPKDQLEMTRIYSQEFEKELDAKKAQEEQAKSEQEKVREERRTEILKQVDAVYVEFGIKDEKEQDKVAALAAKWANEGTANWSIGTLKLAADHLKAKGEIAKPAAKPEPKIVVEEDKNDKKKDINRLITKPNNEGGDNKGGEKKSIADLRRRDLNQIVADHSDALG